MRIKIVQDILNFIRGKKRIITPKEIKKIHNKISSTISQLSQKEKIKVAFLHMYATDTQDLPFFEAMLSDELFDPYFIVNPDIIRSKENFDFNYNRTKKELIQKYGAERVLDGYNYETNSFIDYTDKFDIASTNNPYDHMANLYYQIKYWAKKGKPIFYSNYSYMGRTKYEKNIYNLLEFKFIWKIFTENEFSKLEMISCGINKDNIEIAGYAKLDKLIDIPQTARKRKKIIIAPHHTIFQGPLNLGSFLKYSDLIARLPQMYPDIDFIFRPHPLLVENLRNDICWGIEKTEEYLQNLQKNSNVEYQLCGEYLDTFINSDALIHDCGSFLSEYMYTQHPQCHMFKSQDVINNEFTSFGKEILGKTYKAFSEEDIINFIDNVVIKENDTMKQDRIDFSKKHIMINYPNATNFVIETIKNSIKAS